METDVYLSERVKQRLHRFPKPVLEKINSLPDPHATPSGRDWFSGRTLYVTTVSGWAITYRFVYEGCVGLNAMHAVLTVEAVERQPRARARLSLHRRRVE